MDLYSRDIDSYFASFKEHDVIKYAVEIREKYGIGYDAVISFAVHIEIKNGTISFIENVVDNSLERRWTKETATDFLNLLNDFYTETAFHQFYTTHQVLYTTAQERFEAMLDSTEVDFNWFEKFYGNNPTGSFNLILIMCNAGGNYGPHIEYTNGTKNIYAVMGLSVVDSAGYPMYYPRIKDVIIHEYNHSFCNPLIDEFYTQMAEKAETFYEPVKRQMSRQAYGEAKINAYQEKAAAVQPSGYRSVYYRDKDFAASFASETGITKTMYITLNLTKTMVSGFGKSGNCQVEASMTVMIKDRNGKNLWYKVYEEKGFERLKVSGGAYSQEELLALYPPVITGVCLDFLEDLGS
jgi:hypothetical protein